MVLVEAPLPEEEKALTREDWEALEAERVMETVRVPSEFLVVVC